MQSLPDFSKNNQVKPKSRILVIDDEKLVRWSVGEALTKINYTVELATSGEEAIEKVKQTGFNLVISDFKMDGLNGIEVGQEIKKISPETKIVVITAFHSELSNKEIQNENIAFWIAKPFKMQQLTEVVQWLLS